MYFYNVHKNILASGSEYFDKLFNYDTQSEHNIIVEYPKIAEDVIMSIYGKTITFDDLFYRLQFIKLQQYWQMENNARFLYNINIPREYFYLFMEVAEYYDYSTDWKLLLSIKKNYPPDIDNITFSPKLANLLLQTEKIIISYFDPAGRKLTKKME